MLCFICYAPYDMPHMICTIWYMIWSIGYGPYVMLHMIYTIWYGPYITHYMIYDMVHMIWSIWYGPYDMPHMIWSICYASYDVHRICTMQYVSMLHYVCHIWQINNMNQILWVNHETRIIYKSNENLSLFSNFVYA